MILIVIRKLFRETKNSVCQVTKRLDSKTLKSGVENILVV